MHTIPSAASGLLGMHGMWHVCISVQARRQSVSSTVVMVQQSVAMVSAVVRSTGRHSGMHVVVMHAGTREKTQKHGHRPCYYTSSMPSMLL